MEMIPHTVLGKLKLFGGSTEASIFQALPGRVRERERERERKRWNFCAQFLPSCYAPQPFRENSYPTFIMVGFVFQFIYAIYGFKQSFADKWSIPGRRSDITSASIKFDFNNLIFGPHFSPKKKFSRTIIGGCGVGYLVRNFPASIRPKGDMGPRSQSCKSAS